VLANCQLTKLILYLYGLCHTSTKEIVLKVDLKNKMSVSDNYPQYATGIVNKKGRIINLMKKGTFPKLGTTIMHKEGLALIEAYIKSIR
jgi:hypothetical protein